jgi:hypothetical protein
MKAMSIADSNSKPTINKQAGRMFRNFRYDHEMSLDLFMWISRWALFLHRHLIILSFAVFSVDKRILIMEGDLFPFVSSKSYSFVGITSLLNI